MRIELLIDVNKQNELILGSTLLSLLSHVDDVLVEYLLLFILKINFPDVCQVCVGASANTMNQNITLRCVLIIDEFLIFYFFEFFLKE